MGRKEQSLFGSGEEFGDGGSCLGFGDEEALVAEEIGLGCRQNLGRKEQPLFGSGEESGDGDPV